MTTRVSPVLCAVWGSGVFGPGYGGELRGEQGQIPRKPGGSALRIKLEKMKCNLSLHHRVSYDSWLTVLTQTPDPGLLAFLALVDLGLLKPVWCSSADISGSQ